MRPIGAVWHAVLAAHVTLMIAGIRLKVCGITSLVDADAADAIGADFLGFIFHPKSPRHIELAQWRAMAGRLPPRRRVAVSVNPSPADLRTWVEAGFDAFQVHFPLETDDGVLASWAEAVGRDRLWLAPKMPPGVAFPERVLAHAGTILWDTYAADGYGGTGRTGDWSAFRRAREAHVEHTWILAGGLAPDNVAAALAASGARFLDINSGVELSPGVKDPARLKALAAALAPAR